MASKGGGITLRITINSNLSRRLGLATAMRSSGIASFTKAASEVMLHQAQSRFREQRDPDGEAWRPLAPATVAQRGSSRPILEVSGSLRGGLHASAAPRQALVSTSPVVYAGIHQAGGQAGRGLSVTIPARPYLGFGNDDVQEIKELAEDMIFKGLL